jgi:hypothetical protein
LNDSRDIVEVKLDLGGVPCILRDTAGLRSKEIGGAHGFDVIELEGMKRARFLLHSTSTDDLQRGVSLVSPCCICDRYLRTSKEYSGSFFLLLTLTPHRSLTTSSNPSMKRCLKELSVTKPLI